MSNTNHPLPTDGELEILQILWEIGPATVRMVNESMNQSKPVGYTTTLKLLQIMDSKGLVSRDSSQKVHIYQAALPPDQTRKALLDRFLETTFQGAAGEMVLQLLGGHRTTEDELSRIRQLLADQDPKKP
ncbi:MAG: BlaI/MecI/CopY family transcriptional regulator [Lewinellaceae bacterium]|mgnify:CR=1 FL=1|nr:BlaI/MecI/CopY family transcriptional regulator [Saprospiraceae bacterium]MCB9313217.1 BlaI/MecI/CopY family transcriptional regulator [Lewinellaceae bacterium]HRW75425.1 BlaI/MecI/CopY family transcriptional regulator [Saprospiraceae bacterium]